MVGGFRPRNTAVKNAEAKMTSSARIDLIDKNGSLKISNRNSSIEVRTIMTMTITFNMIMINKFFY